MSGRVLDEKALGKRLQLARRRAGLTQQELCHKAELSYSTLAKIERGAIRSPSVFTVAAIAGVTNTPLEDLLDLAKRGLKSPAPPEAKKTSKNGVRFVYFDVNGVLVRFFHRAFTKIAEQSGESTDAVETLFWRHNDAVCRGQMSLKEFDSLLGHEFDLAGFDWQEYYLDNVEPIEPIAKLVEWTAKHYEIGLLSNNMPGFIDELRARKLIPDVFYTTIVDSSKVGVIKPEPRIYEIAQQLASVKPEEILLLDDSRSNLVAADRQGWHVMWFDDFRPEESIDKARQSLEF